MFPIVKKKFSPAQFQTYVENLPKPSWVKGIVLHNTASPSLAMRKGGILTPQHIDYLLEFYAVKKKWKSGPHLFVDAEGIWVFNPLTARGTHSPSFNGSMWGVEMLGDFETESFTTGLGAQVRELSCSAVATLFRKLNRGLTSETFKFHHEDPATTHDCPGKNAKNDRARFEADVKLLISGAAPPVPIPAPTPAVTGIPTKIVVYRKGKGPDPAAIIPGVIRNGVAYADSKKLLTGTGISSPKTGDVPVKGLLSVSFVVTFDEATGKVYAVEK